MKKVRETTISIGHDEVMQLRTAMRELRPTISTVWTDAIPVVPMVYRLLRETHWPFRYLAYYGCWCTSRAQWSTLMQRVGKPHDWGIDV